MDGIIDQVRRMPLAEKRRQLSSVSSSRMRFRYSSFSLDLLLFAMIPVPSLAPHLYYMC